MLKNLKDQKGERGSGAGKAKLKQVRRETLSKTLHGILNDLDESEFASKS